MRANSSGPLLSATFVSVAAAASTAGNLTLGARDGLHQVRDRFAQRGQLGAIVQHDRLGKTFDPKTSAPLKRRVRPDASVRWS